MVVAETDGFSYYVLVFSYETETYTLSRATTVTANEIARAVGLPDGDVTNVTVEDDSHINAYQTSGIWLISENGSFDGTETVGFTINGVTYDIEISVNTEATQEDRNDVIGYGIGVSNGSNYGFNVWGYNGDEVIGTNYSSQNETIGRGYRTHLQMGSETAYIGNFTFGKAPVWNGVEVYVTADISGNAVLITYTLTNTTDSDLEIKVGSGTDCKIGHDDKATVSTYGNGLTMVSTKSEDNGARFILLPAGDEFTTLWAGIYDQVSDNIFTDKRKCNCYSQG